MPIPDVLKPLLADYLNLMEQELPGLMVGCYLHGSIALGAFDPVLSDVDFLTILQRPCTPLELQTVAALHDQLKEQHPIFRLEGSYIQLTDLGKLAAEMQPVPGYHDGEFQAAAYHDINPVTWWVLKKHGITLHGEEATTLPIETNFDQLHAYMLENLNSYWKRFTREPRRMIWLLNDDGVQWAVLGVLRQFYTLRERDITSKIGAGEYALEHLPSRWHRIIQEALNIRHQHQPSLYHWRIIRAVEAARLLRHVIQRCNAMDQKRPTH